MIYIKLENNDIEENSKIRKVLKWLSKLKVDEFDGKSLIKINDLENRTLNKLSKYLKAKCINRVCLSENLMNNDMVLEFIKKESINLFDRKMAFYAYDV